jgi:DNA-binding CsgD family transcriptional regulator
MSKRDDLEVRIVDAIYRGACDSAEMGRSVELIAEYFDSPAVVLGELDRTQPQGGFTVGVRACDEQFIARYGPYAELDPAPKAYAALAVGTAAVTNQLFSESFRRRHIFVNEFLVPHGIDGTLGSPLLSAGGRFAMIGVFQREARRSYDHHDIARLERLTPHLTRALQIRRLLLQSEARGKTLEAIVDRNETAMIGLGGDGLALFVNSSVRKIAAAHDGIGIDRQGRLVAADRSVATRLAALQADVALGGAGGLVSIPRPSGRAPYVVLVSPLPSGDDLFPKSRNGVLFAIHDPAGRKPPTEQRIAELLRIPPGAAKVLQAILEGRDLREFAERADISMNTVRFHLKTAFALTGTHRQADLVRIALSALNDLGPYFPDSK